MSLIDDFNLLELPTNATEQEAKAAYRRLARRFHPDKNPDRDTTEHFQRIHDAYQNVSSAIKRSQGQSWEPYSFTERATKAKAADYKQYEFDSDVKQKAYVKEQQRAYEKMKRSNAEQERVREEALRTARSTLHQRRVNALYEEMRKAENYQSSEQDYSSFSFDPDTSNEATYADNDESRFKADLSADPSSVKKPFKLYAAKSAFIACTYLATFAIGIYSAEYFQHVFSRSDEDKGIPYISGLYPQFSLGEHYTLNDTRLFTEPSVASSIKTTIPSYEDVNVLKSEGDWLTLTYQGTTGWAKTENLGFGTASYAMQSGCLGHPGVAPNHGDIIGTAKGSSRLRILNQLPQASILTFESLDGTPPFSVYLHANQPFAANFIPRGKYRLVLKTGSLYHQACQRFLFDGKQRVVLDQVSFASTEQSLTLRNLTTP